MADETKPTQSGAMSVPEGQAHEMFELADEEQVLAELSGRVTHKFVYQLHGIKDPMTGQDVVGLSYAGTNWAVREYAKQGEYIRIVGKPEFMVDPTDNEYVLITVMAQRFAIHPETGQEIPMDNAPGIKRQWRKMKRVRYLNGEKIEEIVDDPFFWEKGLSKATRNAKQALIPVDFVKQMIAKALQLKNAGEVKASSNQQQPQKPSAASSPLVRPKTSPAPSGSVVSAPSVTPAPSPSRTTAGSATPPAQATADKGTLVQQVDAVLKKLFKTTDTALVRQHFKKLTGSDQIGDLEETKIRQIARLLQGCIKGTHKLVANGTQIAEAESGKIIWPEVPPPAPVPASEESQSDEEFNF